MIKSIDGLKLPASIDCISEMINRDSTTQAVSGRLITNLDPNPKWQLTVDFNEFGLNLPYQAEFYNKCLIMRTTPKLITFISPYTNEELTITARCIGLSTPKVLAISNRSKFPLAYSKAGAIFQEV